MENVRIRSKKRNIRPRTEKNDRVIEKVGPYESGKEMDTCITCI